MLNTDRITKSADEAFAAKKAAFRTTLEREIENEIAEDLYTDGKKLRPGMIFSGHEVGRSEGRSYNQAQREGFQELQKEWHEKGEWKILLTVTTLNERGHYDAGGYYHPGPQCGEALTFTATYMGRKRKARDT